MRLFFFKDIGKVAYLNFEIHVKVSNDDEKLAQMAVKINLDSGRSDAAT